MVGVPGSNPGGSIIYMDAPNQAIQEFPEYIIKPDTLRAIVPTIVVTFVLALVFYGGIALNIYLLGIQVPGSITVLIFSVLGLLVIMQALLTYVRTSHTKYYVYKNRIQFVGQKENYIMFNTVNDIKLSKNFIDTFFRTGTITMQPNLTIKGITNPEQTFTYLKQMTDYARGLYNRI